jgi:predicted RNase H-like HicB family nuclease
MENLNYFIYREGNYYVSQCLSIEVASFGETINEALANALYLED